MKKQIRAKLIYPNFIENYFSNENYICLPPYSVVNPKNDTIFTTAGIQPILHGFIDKEIDDTHNFYISQPVIRTQFITSLSEGYSLAFNNITTVGINKSHENHQKLLNDWMNFFYELGLKKQDFTYREKEYTRNWGKLTVSGHKVFISYKGIELGDTTFFDSVIDNFENRVVDTLSDVGFGLERIRWVTDFDKSYYDIGSDSKSINPSLKALISAITLLVVNKVTPSNKEAGYRIRLFSKNIVNSFGINCMDINIDKYIEECIFYWINWQKKPSLNIDESKNIILKELERNGNRLVLDQLSELGINISNGININIPREDFIKRLTKSHISNDILKKILK